MSNAARLESTTRPAARADQRSGLSVVAGGRTRLHRDASVDLVPDSRAGEWVDDRAPRSLSLVRIPVDDEAGCEAVERQRHKR